MYLKKFPVHQTACKSQSQRLTGDKQCLLHNRENVPVQSQCNSHLNKASMAMPGDMPTGTEKTPQGILQLEGDTHAHTHINACTHARMHAHTRAHMHAYTRAHTHSHPNKKKEILSWDRRGMKELELGKRGAGVLRAVTLIWLHIHVWSGTIVSHWLPLTHCHLVLHGHALGRWHRMVVASHGAVATRRHIHGAVRHAELTGSRSLHWHMVRPFKEKRSERTVRLRVTEVHGTGLLIITELAAEAAS